MICKSLPALKVWDSKPNSSHKKYQEDQHPIPEHHSDSSEGPQNLTSKGGKGQGAQSPSVCPSNHPCLCQSLPHSQSQGLARTDVR